MTDECGDDDRLMRTESGSDRTALDEIARAHAVLAGRPRPDLVTALRLARRRAGAEDVDEQIEGLSELLWALDKTDDKRTVARVADRLVRAAAGIDQDLDSATGPLVEVVQALAGVGQVDQAEHFIATIRHPSDQGESQRILVLMLAHRGDLRRAEQTAGAIDDADARSNAWIELVAPMAEAGDGAGALRAAQRAQESIAAVPIAGDQPRKLNHLVQVLVQSGFPAEARRVADLAAELAGTITDPHDRDWAHTSAVHALTFAGQFDRAEQLIPRIIDRSPREVALLKVSIGVGEAGDFDRGMRLADTITDGDARSTAQGQQVRLMAEAGDFERAQSAASTVASPSSRADALGDLAGAMAAAGDRAGARPVVRDAEQAAATIEHPATRSLVRQRLVDELIDGGDFEQAEVTVLAAVEDRDPAGDLGRVARAMLEAGDLDGARRLMARVEPLATSITDPDSRAWALSTLAENFFTAGAVDDAVRLLVEATGTGPWYRTLSAVAVVAPDTIRPVAEDLLIEEPPPGD